MPYATVGGGLRLHYVLAGQGSPVLLLHGIGSNSRSFRRQLEDLGEAFTAIAWDMPGYGGSDDPAEPFTLEDLADHAAALLDRLKLPQAHLVGHSLGGVVAQMLFHRHPRRVASLVLADTNPGSGSLPEPERSARVARRLEAIASQTPRQIAEARAPSLVSADAPRDLVQDLVDTMAQIRPAGYRAAAIVMGSADLRDLLPSIDVPTLVVCGEQDRVTPPDTAALLAESIPGARLALIPGAGHASNQEQPTVFNRVVREFLQAVPCSR